MANWLKITQLVLDMLIKYGPSLVKAAQEIYEWVETWSKGRDVARNDKPTGSVKAAKFNIMLIPQWEKIKGVTPSIAQVADLREKTVAKNNLKTKAGYSYHGGKPG